MDAPARPRRRLRPWPEGFRWRAPLAIGCAIAGVAALVVVWQQPGFPEVPPQSIDNSVWVVNASKEQVGRINPGIGELDSAAPVRQGSEVVQDPMGQVADVVLVADQDKHELQVLDPKTVTLGTRVTIPDDAAIQLWGGTLAVADRSDGRLWVGRSDGVESVDARLVGPVATVGALPVVAVSTRGTVVATAAGATSVLRVAPGAEPASTPFADGPLSLGGGTVGASSLAPGAADIQITTVGETPVVLDRADSSLRVGDRRLVLPALPGAVLQQSGPAAAGVLIATTGGLVDVDLENGAVTTLVRANGVPVAPAVNGDCRFGAWLPSPTQPSATQPSATLPSATLPSATLPKLQAVAACGDAQPALSELAGSTPAATLGFRQRGAVVVLGDNASGRSWIATAGYRLVDNWDDVAPAEQADDTSNTNVSQASPDDLPPVPPDCTDVTPTGTPKAADDVFGVRAGRATVLRVLDNDPSVNCASVVIDSVSALPAEVGTVAIVGGGSAIQVTVPRAAPAGRLPDISYQVGNGRGGETSATVQVSVREPTVDEEPQRVRRSAVTTEVNGTVSYNVLDDYFSPTGDDLYLLSATADTADEVSFRPDGTITYHSTGGGVGGQSRVTFLITDGSEQASGTLTVSIAPPNSTTPAVYPVYTRAVIGSAAHADPARSVVSASADPVQISTVQPEPDSTAATAALDPQTGSVSVTATNPGTYYFTF